MTRKNILMPVAIEAMSEGKLFEPLTPDLSIEMILCWHFRRRIAGVRN